MDDHVLIRPLLKKAATPAQMLRAMWMACMELKASMALWRLPDQSRIHFIADFNSLPVEGALAVHEDEPGFVIHPFDTGSGHQPLFLKPRVHFYYDQEECNLHHTPDAPAALLELLGEKLEDREPAHGYHHPQAGDESCSASQSRFLKLVRQARWAIQEKQVTKVVAARTMKVDLPSSLDILNTFNRLEKAYPSAFANLVTTPEYGTWMGASPELLVEISRNHVFKTMALAGTRPCPEGCKLPDVLWNQKEIEEQAMVSRYIIEQFKKIRLREFIENGPANLRIGSIAHLSTVYTVDLNEVDFPDLGTVMLGLLHPTSAVCGMPRQGALDFIAGHEGFDRRLFSGYMGPVNMDDETRLFVNLRCMQLQEGRAVLYAGAGITHLSDSEREWVETGWKCQTMKSILN